MNQPVELPGIRIITVSGRIASGSTTLAKNLAKTLGWKHLEGGEIFWEAIRSKLGCDPKDTNKRADIQDQEFDDYLKNLLETEKNIVLETKLAGFNAQEINGIYKILVVCNDYGIDQTAVRIDRLVNREKMSITEAKEEVLEREKNDLEKWRRMYAKGDLKWVYWDEKYYDLVLNTFIHDKEESLSLALEVIRKKS